MAVKVGLIEEADCASGGGEAGVDVGAEVKRLLDVGCSYEWPMQQYFGILISCETLLICYHLLCIGEGLTEF